MIVKIVMQVGKINFYTLIIHRLYRVQRVVTISSYVTFFFEIKRHYKRRFSGSNQKQIREKTVKLNLNLLSYNISLCYFFDLSVLKYTAVSSIIK